MRYCKVMIKQARGWRSAGLAYAAALALLCFMALTAWQFFVLDQNVQRQITLGDAAITHRTAVDLLARWHAQREQTHRLARIGILTSLAFVPFVGLWMAGFAFTLRRASIDRSHALKDSLTGAGNRRSALSTLRALIREGESRFGVIFIDLDGFKKINDLSGHASGDAILQQVTARLMNELRAADTVCRLGGDEFICIVAPPTSTSAIYAIAQRLRRSVARTYELQADHFVLDCSVGVSVFPQDGRDAHVLLERADRAMYSAKADGGGVRTATALIERRLPV